MRRIVKVERIDGQSQGLSEGEFLWGWILVLSAPEGAPVDCTAPLHLVPLSRLWEAVFDFAR